MYKIFADDTLIYDSTVEDFQIGSGEIVLEPDKSGSFTFSLYPDHPYYDQFVKLRTVITVYKSGRIVFRGRVLTDTVDYWNQKVLTCEGELGFLQDSIIRPYTFNGTPAALFRRLINEHNAQVDEFKQFRIGTITVQDSNDYVARSNSDYNTAFENITSRLLEDATGGHLLITHGADGTDPVPTIHYLADYATTAAQDIEFGSNLRDYTKTASAEEIATAIIPLGATVDDGDDATEDRRLTIAAVNNGLDYVHDPDAVALYGWIFRTVEWDDVTEPDNLKAKALAYLDGVVGQNITVELTAIDLHLLDRSIESFHVCEYVHVYSPPHGFDGTMLCNKQTLDLLNPANDTVTLGYSVSVFTEASARQAARTAAMASNANTAAARAVVVTEQAAAAASSAGQAATSASEAASAAQAAVSVWTVPGTTYINGDQVLLASSTPGSSKRFKLTVDDAGVLTASEYTT